MSTSQINDSPRIKLVRELVAAVERKDVGALLKHAHNDFRRINYPRSFGKPEETSEELLRDRAEILNLWTGDSEAS